MSKIHVLTGSGSNLYTVVVHIAAPVGNNSAGVSWVDALKNSGRATESLLTVGNGAGQITQAELNQIQAGTLIEGAFQWGDNPGWTNAQRIADLDIRATQLTNELLARYAAELKFFGFVRS